MTGQTLTSTGQLQSDSTASLLAYVRQPNGILRLDPFGQDLVDYLPAYMQEGFMVRAINEALGEEMQRALDASDELLAQFTVSTATYGLTYWEELLGLPNRDGQSDALRRSIIFTTLHSRNLGSEGAFLRLLEDTVGGTVYINPYEPSVRPYTIEIESQVDIVEDPPIQACVATEEGDPGNLNGTYSYRVTFIFGSGETSAGLSESNQVSVINGQVTVSDIPISIAPNVVGRRIYRKRSDEPDYHFVAELDNNVPANYIDNISDMVVSGTPILSDLNEALNGTGLRLHAIVQASKPSHIHCVIRQSRRFLASISSPPDPV